MAFDRFKGTYINYYSVKSFWDRDAGMIGIPYFPVFIVQQIDYYGIQFLSIWIPLIIIIFALTIALCYVIIVRSKPKKEASSKHISNNKLPEEKCASLKEKRDELILDLIKRRYDSELERLRSIDSKGSSVIGFVSVVIGLLVGVGTIDLLGKLKIPEYAIPYFIGVGMLILSVSFSLYAVKVRRYDVVPEVKYLLDRYLEAEYRLAVRRIAATIADTVKDLEKLNENKAKWVDRSWYFLLIGLVLASSFLIITIATGNIKPQADVQLYLNVKLL